MEIKYPLVYESDQYIVELFKEDLYIVRNKAHIGEKFTLIKKSAIDENITDEKLKNCTPK